MNKLYVINLFYNNESFLVASYSNIEQCIEWIKENRDKYKKDIAFKIEEFAFET